VFVKLLLLLLWFGKELDLVAHNKDIALQKKPLANCYLFHSSQSKGIPSRPKKCNSLLGFATNAISFLATPTPHFLVVQFQGEHHQSGGNCPKTLQNPSKKP